MPERLPPPPRPGPVDADSALAAPPRRRGPDPGSRGLRRAWLAVGSVAAVLALALGTLSIVSRLAHEEHSFQMTFDEQIAVLDVQVDAGAIRVVGGSGPGTTVTAQVSDGLWSSDHRQAVEGDRLVLRGDCPIPVSDFCRVDYTVEVPRGVDVVARSSWDGRISITNVDGHVDAATDNGPIEVDGVDGDVALRTSNGRISATGLAASSARAATDNGAVRLSFVEPPRHLEVRSRNGSVQVVLPDTPVAYAVSADTSFGSIETPIRTDPTSSHAIVARTSRGDIRLGYPGS